MSMLSDAKANGTVSSISGPAGEAEIPGHTELTRLHYYDGKFLRADDLRAEQDYQRFLVELANRAGGSGVVYGFDVGRGSGDELTIGGGLAFDAEGRVLYMPGLFSVALHDLIGATSNGTKHMLEAGEGAFVRCIDTKDQPGPSAAADFYVITIAHAEAPCGEEDVFGKLCEDACATSAERPWLVEGVLVRARPFQPHQPYPSSKVVQLTAKHLRSQLASAWFADEARQFPNLISGAGLRSGAWCTGAARLTGSEVAIAVVSRLASEPWIDEWIVRRERMETPPRRFWDWTMAMRPWDAYLAQILQFQCQLPSALQPQPPGSGTDPCAPYHAALKEATKYFSRFDEVATALIEKPPAKPSDVEAAPAGEIAEVEMAPVVTSVKSAPLARDVFAELGGIARFRTLHAQLQNVLAQVSTPSQRILVDGGIVELPPAGYLPVTPGTTPPVEDQVRRLLGDGVDLRFCIVRHDYVAHALEEAQHMDRISLLTGLDDPSQKQQVDIYVPDGQVVEQKAPPQLFFDTKVVVVPRKSDPQPIKFLEAPLAGSSRGIFLHGAARGEPTTSGGATAYLAVAAELMNPKLVQKLIGVFLGGDPLGFVGGVASLFEEGSTTPPVLGARARAAVRSFTEAAAAAGTFDGVTGAGSAVPLAAWAELGCKENPFDLPAGGSTSIDFILDGGSQHSDIEAGVSRVGISAELTGTLTTLPGGVSHTGTKRTLGATFTGDAIATRDIGGQKQQIHGHAAAIQVKLTLDEQPNEAVLMIEFKVKKQALFIEAAWSDSHPLRVVAGLVLGQKVSLNEALLVDVAVAKPNLPVVIVGGSEDASVADASAPIHQHALDAIDLVAAAVEDPALAAAAKKKLFPDPVAGGRSIVATQDWVLFQRRRTSDCGPGAAPKPVPVATRTYRVWEASVESIDSAQFVIRAIEKDDYFVKRYQGHVVGDVQFTAGTSTLVSDAAAVLDDWRAAKPAAQIVYGAIATDLTDETSAILAARVKAYEAAVSSVSEMAPNADTRVLSARKSIPANGGDGVLVFVTTPKLKTVVHRVFAVRENDKVPSAIKTFQTTRGLKKFIATLNPTLVGTVTFELDTSNVTTADVKKLPFGEFGRLVDEFVVASLETAPANQPLDDQGLAIIKAVGGDTSHTAQKVETVPQGEWEYAEPFVTVLLMDIEA